MAIPLKYNTASQEIPLGHFVDSTDGDTEETGLTIANTDIKLWKSGATTLANKNSGGGTHISNGVYYCTLDATDTNTYGPLVVFVHVSGALAVRVECVVMESSAYDALYAAAGTGHIEADMVQVSGDATAANNLELDYDGTGYAKTNSTIGTCTTNTDMRGTDSAALASVCTEGRLSELDAANIPTDLSEIDSNVDAILVDTGTTLPAQISGLNDLSQAEAESACDASLASANLDHLVGTATGIPSLPADTYLDQMMDNGTAAFDRTTDSLQAIRDRGDAAWTTGGGGSISDILDVQPSIPTSIDLADTATVRLGLMLTNAVDDLPSTAEITPGTIDIHRKAIGGTSWSAVVTGGACSEQAGLIYYDEVFDSGTGYAEGDSIRLTFKSQKITVAANDYEITDSNGVMFYTEVRQTMRGTDSAATASALSTHDGKLDTVDSNVDAVLVDTGTTIPAQISGLNDLSQAEANAACDTALADYDGPTNAEMEARTLAAADYATAAGQSNIETDTQDIQSRLPAALAGGKMDSDATAISGSTDAADKLEASAETMQVGTVLASPAPSTTTFASSGMDSTDDHYNGRLVIFTSGVLLRQASDITDYAGASGQFTVTAMTEAPSAGDTFIIV